MKKTPDGKVHNCATHVEHVVLGKGTTVSEQHAEPDANGNIEWYTVQFENSVQKVLTKDLTITMSEAHMHESSEEQFDEEEKKKPVSPFDYKNYKSEIPRKPGELTGHDSKKISTGTVYTKKPVKEEASKESKKDFQDRQQRLAAAGAETAKDPARLKRMSNIPGYSAAMDLAKKTTLGAKHTKEEVEQMDELSTSTLKSYISGAQKDRASQTDSKNSGDREEANYAKKQIVKRTSGIVDAKSRLNKEEVEQEEYTFADYLEAARAKYVDEDAVLVANEAFKNKDITLFIDQSQSPEA